MLGRFLGSRGAFLAMFAVVTFTLLGASFWVISFVWSQVRPSDAILVDEALSAIYVNYYSNADNYISAESYVAMANYVREFPEPQNVQVLVGSSTQEIIGLMRNHFSAGMGVNCNYCHTLENFAADMWDDPVGMANKVTARAHLRMVRDLNYEWLADRLVALTTEKRPSGVQVTCTICHNGQPKPVTWPVTGSAQIPASFRLPLDPDVVFSVEEQGLLNVNARSDISLDTVQYNQQVMYHMNESLGVGCTHCHNSRYFPSWEVPAKYYALHMLQMSQFIQNEYGEWLGGQQPSCNMCHQGAAIPPGAVRAEAAMSLPNTIFATR